MSTKGKIVLVDCWDLFQFGIPQLNLIQDLSFSRTGNRISLDSKSVEYLEDLKLTYYIRLQGNITDEIVGLRETIEVDGSETEFEITFLDNEKRQVNGIFNWEKENQFSEDIGRLLDDDKFKDAVITCKDGSTIDVHKCILSARSEVFKKHFRNPDIEKQQKPSIKVNHDKAVMKSVLEFIYKGQVNVNDPPSVFKAAHEFELSTLKKICKMAIFDSISPKNAVSNLIMADSFGEEMNDLKRNILIYIKLHFRDVSDSGEILQLKEFPSKQLVQELIHAIANPLNKEL